VTPNPPTLSFNDGLRWQKAQRSGDNGGNCVYVARRPDGMIGLRDSKAGHDGQPQWYNQDEWDAFLDGAKKGEFDNV
jgi:hypothetical protein